MSMKQIETLVFDYGGVIVNIDDASVILTPPSISMTVPRMPKQASVLVFRAYW